MDSRETRISLATFQKTDFNVASLVESLMEDDVRKAKDGGQGGELFPYRSKRGGASSRL